MPATMPRVLRGQSCWTDEYLVGHCGNYRVETETGNHVGSVDRVVWSEDGFEPQALLVDVPHATSVLVPLADVLELHVEGERLVISSAVLADLAVARREPSGT